MTASAKIRVLVVDDSTLIREVLRRQLSAHPRIEVVAAAADPYEARAVIESQPVDVVTLDLEMPRMDGLTFLRHLMRDRPLPVIVVSSLAGDGEAALACLSQGAVGLVAKPAGTATLDGLVADLTELIVGAAAAEPRLAAKAAEPARMVAAQARRGFIVVGASTGGTQALEALFRSFPASFPPVVAVIHMPAGFTAAFARRLDTIVPMTVKEAEDGEPLTAGTIYIAPGGRHVLVRGGPRRTLGLTEGPKVYNQRPAVDVLFRSAAQAGGAAVCGVLLTGMGKDGALGLKAIRDAGGATAAQDEATSVIFGMPKEAILLGAAQAVLPLPRIGEWVASVLE
jgi:two-component system chemotaxis response regulator CheB